MSRVKTQSRFASQSEEDADAEALDLAIVDPGEAALALAGTAAAWTLQFDGFGTGPVALAPVWGEDSLIVWVEPDSDAPSDDAGTAPDSKSEFYPVNNPAFDIVFNYVGGNTSYAASANAAAAFWELAILGDLPDIGGVDDLRIDSQVGLLGYATGTDGSGGVLANAGPRNYRPTSFLAYTGAMGIDPADLNNPGLVAIITHEIGHVLAIPGSGQQRGFITTVGGQDRWASTAAVAEYRTLANNGALTYIPMQTGHWEEATFGAELMTPFINTAALAPLSRMTLAALRDLGYAVDLGYSDPFWLASTPTALRDDRSGNYNTTTTLAIGSSLTGTIEQAEDNDWFRVSLNANQTYTFTMKGSSTGDGTLNDPFLRVRAADGEIVASNDDSGGLTNSRVVYTPTVGGTYYLDASGYQLTTGTFRIAALSGNDTTNPLLSATSPQDDAAAVSVGSNITLTFNEAVAAGSGTINIFTAAGALAKSIAVTDASQVLISGNTVTINPTTDLDPGTGYYVNLGAGVVRDLAGNGFAGIAGPTALNFTTVTAGEATVSIAAVSADKAEGSGGDATPFTFTVTRAGGNGAASVQWSLGSNLSPAVNGNDFGTGPQSGQLTWAAGDTSSRTITVLVRADRLHEADERFSVNLSNPVGASLDTGSAVGRIVNDDAEGPGIYRFFNTPNASHFYTSSVEERDLVIRTLPGLRYEGPAFEGATAAAGDLQVFRFLNTTNGSHFYTANPEERDLIVRTLPGYTYEGIAYNAFSGDEGSEHHPLFRFFRPENGTHFYTASVAERDNVIATLPFYRYEGVAYHVDFI